MTECIEHERVWAIKNVDDGSYWSNDWGWIDFDEMSVSIFTDDEKDKFNLPIDGEWVAW